jgi:hypothetical protein
MNDAHLHLALAHLPVIGSLAVALLLVAALWIRQATVRRLALAATVLVALSGIPAYLAGEGAEEVIERQPAIEETRVEAHENLALTALILLEVTGALGLLGLLLFRGPGIPRGILVTVLLVDLGTAALMFRVATLGGEISHPEIRGETVLPVAESEPDD